MRDPHAQTSFHPDTFNCCHLSADFFSAPRAELVPGWTLGGATTKTQLVPEEGGIALERVL